MKQQIDSVFYSLKIDKNLSSTEKIKLIEETYENVLEYVRTYAKNEREMHSFSSYAHVLFSKKIYENVDLDDFILYTQQKEQIERINEEVYSLRDPSNTIGRAKILK